MKAEYFMVWIALVLWLATVLYLISEWGSRDPERRDLVLLLIIAAVTASAVLAAHYLPLLVQ